MWLAGVLVLSAARIRPGATRSLLASDRCCHWPSSAAKLNRFGEIYLGFGLLVCVCRYHPPLARLLAVANEETCCPSQPQENSNGKLPTILIGGRFCRSPVGRRAYLPAAAPNA